MVLSRKRVDFPLQVNGQSVTRVNEFKYLGVLFPSEGKMKREIDRRNGAASATTRKLKRAVVIKRKLGMKAKFSIYQGIYILTLPYGHELSVVTKRMRL